MLNISFIIALYVKRDKVALILGLFDGACQNIGFSAYESREL